MRLDKFLCEMNMGSRSKVKELIKRKKVTVNDAFALQPDMKIDENNDRIICDGIPLRYKPYVYYMLNKPDGVICATKDPAQKTVLDLLREFLPDQDKKREIVPAGRLDKDTEGLLLLTDDGELVHNLLSPKKHVDKTYLAGIRKPLTETEIAVLEEGVDIGDDKKTLPASVSIPTKEQLGEWLEKSPDNLICLTIHEGRFHQVKRMLQAVDNEVLLLKRISFGPLELDRSLKPGECRELTDEEIAALKGTGKM